MIAVISDIHGNYTALKAVIAEIEKLSCNKIISLGDVCGYGIEVDKCIDLLLDYEVHSLLGNHDYYIVNNLPCPRSKVVSHILDCNREVLKKKHFEYLSALSSKYETENSSFVHGSWYDNTDGYLYSVREEDLLGDKKYYFSGHTHVQITFQFSKKIYTNPGSVGQPRDGDNRASFITYDNEKIVMHKVVYDIDETVSIMKKNGLAENYYWENLYNGTQLGGRIDIISKG